MYNITITGKNENVIGCIDGVIAGLYSVVVYQIQQDGAITVVDGVGEESVLLGYTQVSYTMASSSIMTTTSSPLPTGTMYYSAHYNYCYIVGTVAPVPSTGTSITTTVLGNNTLYSVLR